MASVFQRRRIRLTFQLAVGSFSAQGEPDKIALEDFRTQVEIDAPGGFEFATCRMRVYGLAREVMARLTVINYQNLDFHRNSVLVEASDDDGSFTAIFFGEVYTAVPDYAGAPDVAFIVEALSGLVGSLAPSASGSYPGATRVSTIMATLARELGVTLEDNGVTAVVVDQVLVGSPMEKVRRLAEVARIQHWFLPEQGVLAISPSGVARKSGVVDYSYRNGLVGRPVKTHNGVSFTALFNPAAFHGCPIKIDSDVEACNGKWYIISISHRLDALVPGGAWFSSILATPENTTIRSR